MVAVEQRAVAAAADGAHDDRPAAVVVVAHLVGLVGAVQVGRRVGRAALHAAEVVHQLVRLGVVPAAGVGAGVLRVGAVVGVRLAGLAVDVDRADAAVDVGLAEDQVLAVGAVVAARLQRRDALVEAVVVGRADVDLGDLQHARRAAGRVGLGDEAPVAAAAGLGGRRVELAVGADDVLAERVLDRREAVGLVGRAQVEHLDALAGDAVATAQDRARAVGRRRARARGRVDDRRHRRQAGVLANLCGRRRRAHVAAGGSRIRAVRAGAAAHAGEQAAAARLGRVHEVALHEAADRVVARRGRGGVVRCGRLCRERERERGERARGEMYVGARGDRPKVGGLPERPDGRSSGRLRRRRRSGHRVVGVGEPLDPFVDLVQGDAGVGEAQRVVAALEQEVRALDERHAALAARRRTARRR